MKRRFELIIGLAIVLFVGAVFTSARAYQKQVRHDAKVELQKSAKQKALPKSSAKDTGLAGDEAPTAETAKASTKTKMNPVNWKKSSQKNEYPDLDKHPHAYLKVSIAKQRVYIQKERGDFFYNAASKEGAKYWVSFKDHGIYLFHTVPTDKNGKFIPKEAQQLGKEAQSHGCVRLSVPDAKWIYKNVPEGMKVEIH